MNETGAVKKMWLHMLTEGGRWNYAELAMDTGIERHSIRTNLHNMAEYGAVIKHEADDKPTFSVTQSCVAPKGLTIRELVTALRKAGEAV